MKTLIIYILTIAFSVSPSQLQFPDHLIKKYLDIKNALVESDGLKTKDSAAILLEMLIQEDQFPEKSNLIKSAERISRTTDIEKQRKEFNVLSQMMWKLVKTSENLKVNLYYQYCPMKKAYWISDESAIKNPYYGSKMLSCGNVSDSLAK